MSDSEQHRTNVLLEEVLTHVRAVAEGHGVLVDRLDGVDKRLDRVDKRLDGMDVRFDVLDATLAVHGKRLERMEHHLGLNGVSKPRKPATRKKPPKKR